MTGLRSCETLSMGDVKVLAQRLAPVLAALSDPNRLAILLAVTQTPRSVKALTDALDLPQTLVSHHLRTLRDAGVVSVTAQGRSNIYSVCCGPLTEPARLLVALSAGRSPCEQADGPAPDERLRAVE